MPEMHLKQSGFIYSACGPYTKNKDNDKVSFQHDMAYGGFKDLARRTDSNKNLGDKAFNIAKKS